jgi:hypothetical protein
MADSQFIALARADAGLPTSGVIHLRTRLAVDFTVLSNALAQRRGSAVTVGIAAYIQSLPDGAPISITALCRHFSEGEILISRALRELEADGYLERRRERLPSGQVRTRTFFRTVPGARPDPDDDPPKPPEPPQTPKSPRRPAQAEPAALTPSPATEPAAETDSQTETGTETHGTVAESSPAHHADHTVPDGHTVTDGPNGPDSHIDPPLPQAENTSPLAGADPRAIAVLCALRTVDSRLVLSAHEAARLAPAVTEWLGAGVEMRDIIRVLTTRLPDPLLTRPVAILSFRLRETPLLAAPLPRPDPADHHDRLELVTLYPFQTCDGCERAFRAPAAGRCRDCRPEEPLPEPVPGPLPEPLLAAG